MYLVKILYQHTGHDINFEAFVFEKEEYALRAIVTKYLGNFPRDQELDIVVDDDYRKLLEFLLNDMINVNGLKLVTLRELRELFWGLYDEYINSSEDSLFIEMKKCAFQDFHYQ